MARLTQKSIPVLLFFLLFNYLSLQVAANQPAKPVLIISEQKIDPELYYIKGEEVLIAARVFSQTLDTKVRWFGPIKTLQIEKKDLKIKMMVDSTLVQIGKKVDELKVAPKIIQDQMFIPLMYLSSHLGYLSKRDRGRIVIYKPSIRILGFSVLRPGREFQLDLNKKPRLEQFSLEDPSRIVLDIYDALLEEDLNSHYFEEGPVKEVRFSQFKPDVVRAVFEMRTDNNYYIQKASELSDYSLLLTFPPEIKEIAWKDGGLAIKASDRIEEYAVNYLEDPNRLVIDLPNTVINNPQELPGNGPVHRVRSSQFSWEPCVARIVLDLNQKIPFKSAQVMDGRALLLTPQFVRAHLKEVKPVLTRQGNGFRVLLDAEVTPQIHLLKDPPRLVMDLPGTAKEFPARELEVNQDVIKRIRISQFDSETTRIVADLNYLVGYNWNYLNTDKDQIEVKFQNEITEMTLEEEDHQLHLKLTFSGHTEYQIQRLTYPDRLVIDMYGIKINDSLEIPEKTNFIQDIRVSQFSHVPQVARIVLELPFYPGHDVRYREESNNLDLTIPTSKLGGRLIVIDPGHGGPDPGAIGSNGLLEKDVNLAVARELQRLLEKAGARVLMTRTDDSYPSFPSRVGLANKNRADIYVSIHCNSFTEDIPEGTETYVATGSFGKTLLLAELVQAEVAGELRLLDRGVKPANFYVLTNTRMPAILVELAFISNPYEEKLLSRRSFRDRAARAIYRGINRYFSSID